LGTTRKNPKKALRAGEKALQGGEGLVIGAGETLKGRTLSWREKNEKKVLKKMTQKEDPEEFFDSKKRIERRGEVIKS